jgi:energy-coupling factor transport system ATP-binding protein
MTPVLEFDHVSYVYAGGRPALDGVSFSIERSERVAVVGPNGSGKTTLSKHINGLLRPTVGRVSINSADIRKRTVAQLTEFVGFIFQNPDRQIFCYTVWEEVVFGLKLRHLPDAEISDRAAKALQLVGLDHLRDRHPRTLSGGQRQRLAMATVFAMQTDLLILDEPTTGQDYSARRQIMSMVEERAGAGDTVIMVTHDMALVAEYAQRVLVMCGGKLIMDGSPAELFRSTELLEAAHLEKPAAASIAELAGGLGEALGILTWPQLEAAIRERASSAPHLQTTLGRS